MSEKSKVNVALKALKVFGWIILAAIAVVGILLVCAVRFINSKELSPIVEDFANEYIDGNVKLGSLKVGFHPHFPILGVEVKDLSIISHAFDSLTPGQRGLLPEYADSLLTLDYMAGSLNLKRLLVDNELSLHDVVLRGLGVNIVIAHNGKANYEVINIPADTAESSKSRLPGFRIDRFALECPKEIRFYNSADSTSASVLLLTDAAVDGNEQPTYRLRINGNVTSPKAALITNIEHIDFGVNGKVYWNPSDPGLVAMDEMELRGAFIKAVVSGEIDLKNDSPVVRKVVVELKPVKVSDILSVIPDSIRREHRLYSPYFSTDAAIGGRFELLKPMNLATDTFPAAQLAIWMNPSKLEYGKSRLKNIAFDAIIKTVTNLPDSTVVDLRSFSISGPGTGLKGSAMIATPVSDLSFDADVEGKIDFADLPPVIKEKIPGYLAGVISADLQAKGSVSMFDTHRIRGLVADGSVSASNIYFLAADTGKMVEIGKARIDFDSKTIAGNKPLVNARLAVDTATVLVSGVDLAMGAISLNAISGSPVMGDLKVGRFNITALKDSAGAHIRNIGGKVSLRGLKNGSKIPEIAADLIIGKVSAGSLSDRVLLSDTRVKASLLKMPAVTPPQRAASKPVSHREYSYIPPAKVYKYVYEQRLHKKRVRRVYGGLGAEDDEVLVWNLTKQFNRFLNEWKLRGSVNTFNARLLTPFFPLHNHISTVVLRFNNDTVDISNISLRAGRSDLSMSGLVTNVRRAMTAKTDNNLKGNFLLVSDTVDVNELSAAVFTGASYMSDSRHGKISKMTARDDRSLEARLDALSKKGPGRSSPVLIPVNVDANLRVEANHLLYSDFDLQNMCGDLLVYDGAVNLHDIKADSDAGDISVSALYSAPNAENMHLGFGLEVNDFNISKFVSLVPAIDSITPLMHDFSGTIGADVAATCRIDSGMNLDLNTLNAAIRITGDNLAFIDPKKYRTLGKWLGFKDKADNTIHSLNVEMTVADGLMRVYPFAFNIDRYRLGIYGSNDISMNFDYHLSVLKSPLPFKFGITIKGRPGKYKVRFGGARFNEDTAIESVNIVNEARVNLIDQIEGVFKRGVRNSRFARLRVPEPAGFSPLPDSELNRADSLELKREGIIED
ncbi:MAG: AsmA-like C-terminal region-containing protein [Muribaculaceae bacterium]|nr:AsmA-like C-terminal region-containing protein [Muribaculaceae bacterium]